MRIDRRAVGVPALLAALLTAAGCSGGGQPSTAAASLSGGSASSSVTAGSGATAEQLMADAPTPSPAPTSASPSPSRKKAAATRKRSPSPRPTASPAPAAPTAPPGSAPTTPTPTAAPTGGSTPTPTIRPSRVPTVKPVPATPPPTSTTLADEAEVLRLTNVERAKVPGCPALRLNPILAKVARAHSQDMAENNYFAHNSQDGTSPFTRMSRAGYKYTIAAENIAGGQQTPAAVMAAWMASQGHRENILDCRLTELGVGLYRSPSSTYGVYWSQDFGTPPPPG